MGNQTTKPERMSYATFFFGQNLMFMAVTLFLTVYYTSVAGISPLAVGTLFLIARIWDAVNDPILGVIVDKANFKSGKFIPWVRTAVLFLPISFIALFFSHKMGDYALVYAYVTYIAFGMFYTLSDVPIFALATGMTSNPGEQSKLIMLGRMASSLGMLFIMIGYTVVSSKIGYTATSAIFGILAFISMIPISLTAKERVEYNRSEPAKISDIFKFFVSNKNILIFYISLIFMVGFNSSMTLGTYIAMYNFGDETKLALIMALPILATFPLLAFMPKLIATFGKKTILTVGMTICAALSVLIWSIGYDNFGLFLILNFVRATLIMLPLVLTALFAADFVEASHNAQGKRQEGLSFAAQTFSSKASSAIAGFLATVVLAWSGLVLKVDGIEPADIPQTSEAMDRLWIGYNLLPAVGIVIGIVIIAFFYNLNEDDVQQMRTSNR